MKLPTIPTTYLIAGGVAVAALLWINTKGAKNTGQALGTGAVNMVDGILTGGVTGIGEVFNVPPTNLTECERAKLEGRTWDASFACPAKDFLKYVFN